MSDKIPIIFLDKLESSLVSQWFFITRIVGSTAILFSLSILEFFKATIINYKIIAFIFIPFYLSVSFIWFSTSKIKSWNGRFLYLQLFFDIFTITAGIYFSGGIHSEFVYLYLMVVLAAAVISFRAIIITSCVSLLSYVTLIILEQTMIIPALDNSHFGFHNDELIRIAVYSIIAIIASFQGYFYISRIKKKDAEILKLRDEFFFRTVHALRSPETAVRWILEKYSQPEFMKCHPDLKKDIIDIERLNRRIRKLVDDVLIIAKGQELSFKKEAVDIAKVINDITLELKPSMEKNQITLDYNPGDSMPCILADRERICEVFENLIDNAIKYNKIGGSIVITHEVEGYFLKTTVRDSGIGISAEDLSKIFVPYYRASRKVPNGTGLGLYITKILVEKMCGNISVESTLGQGTSFTVSLPLA